MKRVLVTGATGFIGNHVVKALLAANYSVIASSLSEEKARRFSWFAQVTYIPFNLGAYNDNIDYYQFFERPDTMIHLAWEGLPNYTAAFHYEVNLPHHYNFLKNCVQNGLADLTVTGTCFEYGLQQGCLREDMPAQPANAYAIAKDRLRTGLEALLANNRGRLKWIRLFYMYGEGQNPKSLFSQLQKAVDEKAKLFNMSGGAQVRDYLPVEQVAAYIVKITLQEKVTGIINCCSGQPVSVKELVERYLKDHKQSIQLNLGYYPYTDYEPMAFWGDNGKLKLIL